MSVVDFGKLARQARRRGRCAHTEHRWSPGRGGIEQCTSCGDVFPCALCCHGDCILRRADMGTLEPPHDVGYTMTEQRGPMEMVLIDTTPDDPCEWVWPEQWKGRSPCPTR